MFYVTKIQQTPEDLHRHLQEQLGFLERSANAYDRGYFDEAKRLAVTLRVLLHDTAKSKSLLGQLNLQSRDFYDTAVENPAGNLVPYAGLLQMFMHPNHDPLYVPYLDDPLPDGAPRLVSFEKWWERSIFTNQEHQSLSRRNVVLSVANQDGGAHVDHLLDEVYAKLSRQNSMGWVFTKGEYCYPVRPPELAAVRQVAHETLKTLTPSFEKHPELPAGGIVLASPVMQIMTEDEIARFEADHPEAKRLQVVQRPGR
jgi:hypothetical protein